jgi:hypothetical protein
MRFCHSANLLTCLAIVAIALNLADGAHCAAAEANFARRGERAVSPNGDVRNSGVLQESFGYHRKTHATAVVKHPTIAPSGGWYGYGFPVKSYRWGWFGAEHYYPRGLWHHGYNGDHYRWSFQRGY